MKPLLTAVSAACVTRDPCTWSDAHTHRISDCSLYRSCFSWLPLLSLWASQRKWCCGLSSIKSHQLFPALTEDLKGLKVHIGLHSPTYSASCSHGHLGLFLFVLTGTNPISRQPCQFKWSEWTPNWHVIQQYFRRWRPPIPLAANDKPFSPQEVFSWKLIIKYYHLPHPCFYCPLGKNSKKINFWVNHFHWAHRRGNLRSIPHKPKEYFINK